MSSSVNVHYYGWEYIRSKINEFNFGNKVKIIDYMDNYFLNTEEPLTTEWIGIIHHTTSNFSSNNICNLIKSPELMKSMEYCKGIVALSYDNKTKILHQMKMVCEKEVPVYSIKHPKPPVYDRRFNIEAFRVNGAVYNIGGWLRNPYTIYHTNIKCENMPLKKYKLKGRLMDHYFPTHHSNFYNIIDYNPAMRRNLEDDLEDDIEEYSDDLKHTNEHLTEQYNELKERLLNATSEHEIFKINEELRLVELEFDMMYNKLNTELEHIKLHKKIRSKYYSRPIDNINYHDYFANLYIKKFTNKSKSQLNRILLNNNRSVTVVEHLPDESYVNILCNNIVFVDYIDCAASNTIMECIATATPIILNRLPSIEEYLGPEYPFYFDNLTTDNEQFNISMNQIAECHSYLLNMESSRYDINSFLTGLKNIVDIATHEKDKNRYEYYNYIRNRNRYIRR